MRATQNPVEVPGVAISLGVYPTAPVAELVRLARKIDSSRLDTLWLGDSPLIWRECWAAIAWLGARTQSLRIGPCVTNPLSRDPVVTAATVATLQEATDGRIRLGIGVGDSAVRMLHGRVAKLAELERAIQTIRSLLESGVAIANDRQVTLPCTWADTEIAVSGSGPKTLAMAGQTGDSVIMIPGLHTERITTLNAVVDAAANASGRNPAEIGRIVWVACAIADTDDAALDRVRPWVASVLRHPLAFEVSSQIRLIQETIRNTYNFHDHMALVNQHGKYVPDWLVRQFVLAGTASEVKERLFILAQQDGISEIALVLLHDDWAEQAERILPIVEQIPAVRAAGAAPTVE